MTGRSGLGPSKSAVTEVIPGTLLFWLWAYLLRGGTKLWIMTIGKATRLLLLVLLPLAGGFAFLLSSDQRAYKNPRIAAATFDWPRECPMRWYRQSATISRKCVDNLAEFPRAKALSYGMQDLSKGRLPFYRLGNDMASISCALSMKTCHVTNIYRGVFVVPEATGAPAGA